MRTGSAWPLVLLLLTSACPRDGSKGDDDASAEDDDDKGEKRREKKSKKSKKSNTGPAKDTPKTTDFSDWKFVRAAPMERAGVDACAYLGGLGMACLDALLAEQDAVRRRYMRLLSDADARLAQDALDKGEPGGVAHAEAAFFCAESGDCKQTNESGDQMDDGYACLTKAESALQEGDQAAASSAQARACRCDPARAQIPVMGGTLACDGPNQPSARGRALTTERASRIRACAVCDPDKGPAACAAEIDELAAQDAELAGYLKDTHVPRCRQP